MEIGVCGVKSCTFNVGHVYTQLLVPAIGHLVMKNSNGYAIEIQIRLKGAFCRQLGRPHWYPVDLAQSILVSVLLHRFLLRGNDTSNLGVPTIEAANSMFRQGETVDKSSCR